MEGGRVKGTAVLQAVKTLRSMGELARQHVPPSLQSYLVDRIIVSSWYPERDFIGLIGVVTSLMPVTDGSDVWELCGRLAATHDLGNVYKGMVRGETLMRTVKVATDLWKLYYDVGRHVLSGDDTRVLIDSYDYAAPAGYCRFVSGYLREHLRLSTGKSYQVRDTLCTAKGDDHCRREVTETT